MQGQHKLLEVVSGYTEAIDGPVSGIFGYPVGQKSRKSRKLPLISGRMLDIWQNTSLNTGGY